MRFGIAVYPLGFFASFAEPSIEVSAQGNSLYMRDVNKSLFGTLKNNFGMFMLIITYTQIYMCTQSKKENRAVFYFTCHSNQQSQLFRVPHIAQFSRVL